MCSALEQAAAQGVSARTAPSCAPAANEDLKAPVWSCFPAGAGVGSQAEACINFLIKAAYRERNALLLFAFSVVFGSKSSLAVKSSAVDPAKGRISHSLDLLSEGLVASPVLCVILLTV